MKRMIAVLLASMFGFVLGCAGTTPEAQEPVAEEAPAVEATEEVATEEAPAVEATEEVATEAPAEETAEAPAEEPAAQ